MGSALTYLAAIFEKIPFMVKTISKVGVEGAYDNIINTIYVKPTANITLSEQN